MIVMCTVFTDTCLKDGSNLPPSVEQTVETEPEEGKLKKDSMSPFCELYQMVKQDLAAKSPWKSELPKTPLARPQVVMRKFMLQMLKVVRYQSQPPLPRSEDPRNPILKIRLDQLSSVLIECKCGRKTH